MDAVERTSSAKPRDDARLWQVEVFGGMELLHAHFIGQTFAPHTHDEFMIAVTDGGHGSPRFWGGVQQVGLDDLFVLNPGDVHSGGPAENASWRYRGFYPSAALMRRAAQELTGVDRGVPHFAEEVANEPSLAALLRRAHIACLEPSSTLEREARLLEALVRLIAQRGAEELPMHGVGGEHHAVKIVQEYLAAFPGENVALDRLAQEAGLSAFHLCRVFRRATGLSPHAYQLLVRVRLAKTLLARGTPIAQAAVEAGFFDQAHLTRHFRAICGVTPGRYLGLGSSPVM